MIGLAICVCRHLIEHRHHTVRPESLSVAVAILVEARSEQCEVDGRIRGQLEVLVHESQHQLEGGIFDAESYEDDGIPSQ